MNKRELIKKYEEKFETSYGFPVIRLDLILEDLKQLDEPQKVTIPHFVADWIERSKQEGRNLRNALNNGGEKMRLWFLEQENYDIFARAWLDGYEIEQEKRYLVEMKGIAGYGRFLNKALSSGEYFFASKNEINGYETEHTHKELEEAGFGWVFDCPGVEIEEVKR